MNKNSLVKDTMGISGKTHNDPSLYKTSINSSI